MRGPGLQSPARLTVTRLPLLCTLAYSPIRAGWVKDLEVDELMGARE